MWVKTSRKMRRLEIVISSIIAYMVSTDALFDYSSKKRFYLNSESRKWIEANDACHTMNGSLATIYDAGTLPDLRFQMHSVAWIGLQMNVSEGMDSAKWLDGSPVDYSNWIAETLPEDGIYCALIEFLFPYRWTLHSCNASYPSLCEIDIDAMCEFEKTTTSSLVGFNTEYLPKQDLQNCKSRCEKSFSFICRSFEYNEKRKYCQLSNVSRSMHPGSFTNNDREWDYYHKNCFESKILEGNSSEDLELEITTESTGITSIPEYTTLGNMLCRPIADLQNVTTEVQKQIKELQEIGTKLKERTHMLRRTSAPDSRPSVTYVGTAAMAVVGTIFCSIVLFDTLSCFSHCKKRKRRSNQSMCFPITTTTTSQNDESSSCTEERRYLGEGKRITEEFKIHPLPGYGKADISFTGQRQMQLEPNSNPTTPESTLSDNCNLFLKHETDIVRPTKCALSQDFRFLAKRHAVREKCEAGHKLENNDLSKKNALGVFPE